MSSIPARRLALLLTACSLSALGAVRCGAPGNGTANTGATSSDSDTDNLLLVIDNSSSGKGESPGGQPPIADAGDDLLVDEGALVTLDGSRSRDPDGDEITFKWLQHDGPPVDLTSVSSAEPRFAAPSVDSDVVLHLTLIVSDGALTDEDTVAVTVMDIGNPAALGLVADAGPDQEVHEGELVTLDGTGSRGSGRGQPRFEWSQTSGPSVDLSGAEDSIATFLAPDVDENTTLVFDLTLWEGESSARDTLEIRVINLPDSALGECPVVFSVAIQGADPSDPVEGPAPLAVECSVLSVDGSPLPPGTYTWLFDGDEDSGPAETHSTRSHVFTSVGAHTVAFTLTLAGTQESTSCASSPSGSDQVDVIVESDATTGGGGGPPPPVVSDCSADPQCDDGLFCNGPETCVGGTCQAGTDPCPGQMCDESSDLCVTCLADNDCDDGAFCNGAETCVGGTCQAGTDPCPGQMCDESGDVCVTCLADNDCDDGAFCNGAETCVDGSCQPGGDPYLPGVEVGLVLASTVTEASGLAASRQNPGVLWTHDDSGGDNVVFALNVGGTLLGTYRFGSGSVYDAEDIAIGPGPTPGIDYIYFGDIGDNSSVRTTIVVKRAPEPVVHPEQGPVTTTLSGVDIITLQFPSGADAPTHKDAETLLIDTNGDIYIITKRMYPNKVYRAPYPQLTSSPNTLEYVATLPTGTGLKWITAGDLSADGRWMIVRNDQASDYANIWYRQPATALWEAFSGDPCVVALQSEPQGEAITWHPDNLGFYTLSEAHHPSEPIWYYGRAE